MTCRVVQNWASRFAGHIIRSAANGIEMQNFLLHILILSTLNWESARKHLHRKKASGFAVKWRYPVHSSSQGFQLFKRSEASSSYCSSRALTITSFCATFWKECLTPMFWTSSIEGSHMRFLLLSSHRTSASVHPVLWVTSSPVFSHPLSEPFSKQAQSSLPNLEQYSREALLGGRLECNHNVITRWSS